jgi:hypothetical protein
MTALLYRWPPAARFGRVVPKTKFYEHAAIAATVKDRFVSDVLRITWAYKLAESTINLPGSADVPEIQVFEIESKADDVSEGVLAAIDRAVLTPIIFEIRRQDSGDDAICMVAAHKQLGVAAPRMGPYFSTPWLPASTDRAALPTSIDLLSLYTALLQPLTPVASRPGENVSDVVGRVAAARALEREVGALERKLRNEPQLNRKVELRRTLRAKRSDLAQLKIKTDSPAAGNTN